MPHRTLSESHNADGSKRRWYIDGKRVPFGTWWQLDSATARQDSFRTIRRGNRWLHSKVLRT